MQHQPPLAYATEFVDTRRPGIILAVGVLSIVFAVGFGASALFSLLMAIGAAAGPTRGVTTPPSQVGYSAAYPDGIGRTPRKLLVDRVMLIKPLSPARRDVLDAFLAQQGDTLDVRLRTLKSEPDVRKIIAAVGTLPEGGNTLDFMNGRLTLEDDRAIFEPGGTTDLHTIDFSNANPRPGAAGFDAEGENGALVLAESATPTRMNISQGSIALQSVTGILSGILAVLLLVAGIFTIRAKPIGRTLHLWWAWLKIVASMFGAIVAYLFWQELLTQAQANAAQPNAAAMPATVSIVMSLMSLGIAVLYPIAVLIVMYARSVRNYMASA